MAVLPSLTRLTLCCQLHSGTGVPVLYAVRFLEKVPNVKIATIKDLSNHLSLSASNEEARALPISLPSLESLTIKSDLVNGCKFLDCLNIPSLAHLHLSLTNSVDAGPPTVATSETRLSVLATISALLSSFLTLPSHQKHISAVVRPSESSIKVSVGSPVPGTFRKIHVSHQDHFFAPHDFLNTLESSKIISNISKLTISRGNQIAWFNTEDDVHDDSAHRWSKILPSFNSLKLLCITHNPLSFLSTVLQPSHPVLQDQSEIQCADQEPLVTGNASLQFIRLTHVWSCTSSNVSADTNPSLASLAVTAMPTVNITTGETGAVDEQVGRCVGTEAISEDEDMGNDLMKLIKVLKARQNAGRPKIRFTLEKCGINLRQIQLLREHAEVKWDGNEAANTLASEPAAA
ncbi:hypothetical protein ONZ45_g13402 [Pleurotus djamor]|nr:hypothetical protein ONZ45_g13402 [Pleurotus djamor]